MYELHRFILCGKEQFIYDLPSRLGKCIKSEAYADAVKYYTGAMPIFKVLFRGPITLLIPFLIFFFCNIKFSSNIVVHRRPFTSVFILFHQAYGNTSFQDCKRASEEAVSIIKKNLQVTSLLPLLLFPSVCRIVD